MWGGVARLRAPCRRRSCHRSLEGPDLPAAVRQPTTVEVDCGSGDERGLVTREELNRPGNLLGLRVATQRRASLDVGVGVASRPSVDRVELGANVRRVEGHHEHAGPIRRQAPW